MTRYAAAICLALWPLGAAAFEPVLPGNPEASVVETAVGTYLMPVGAFDGEDVPAERFEGTVQKRAWRLPGLSGSVAQLTSDLGAQLTAQGYDIVFLCETEECGGFDFRFNTEVLPPPNMFVDLSDFRFVAAEKQVDGGYEGVGVIVSQTALAAMVQVIRAVPTELAPIATVDPQSVAPTIVPEGETGAVVSEMVRTGRAVLSDLAFETGSTRLGEGPFASLETLAVWLKEDETRRVVLVGHTDSEGALEKNIEISQSRAAAARVLLVEGLGVSDAQVTARGIGYLAPIASNATEEGREANRRVEVVLVPQKIP